MTDGLAALRSIEKRRPDAVVLDLTFPVLSGHVVYQEIRAQDSYARPIPVVVVTGTDLEVDPRSVACVLKKPASPERLVWAVRSCLTNGNSAS